jgi:hypothetical protein
VTCINLVVGTESHSPRQLHHDTIHPSPCLAFPFGLALESCVSLALSKGGCEYSKYLDGGASPEGATSLYSLATRCSHLLRDWELSENEIRTCCINEIWRPPLGSRLLIPLSALKLQIVLACH